MSTPAKRLAIAREAKKKKMLEAQQAEQAPAEGFTLTGLDMSEPDWNVPAEYFYQNTIPFKGCDIVIEKHDAGARVIVQHMGLWYGEFIGDTEECIAKAKQFISEAAGEAPQRMEPPR